MPVREQFGFRVVGAWTVTSDGTEEFVWIVGHDDFEAADRTYYDSPERAAIDPSPATFIEEATTTMMEPADPQA